MTWDEWLVLNKKNIEHIAGFEEQFVNSILRRIPEITPDDVKSQYYFIDSKGGNRYIDFMIINPSKGYALPIELDGIWKVRNYDDFNDMLARQNALITKYGILLRFTNKQMFNESGTVIKSIRDVLSRQQQKLSTQAIAESEIQKTLAEYREKLIELESALSKEKMNKQTDQAKELEDIKKAIKELKGQVNKQPPTKPAVIFPPPIEPEPPKIPVIPTKKSNDSTLAIVGIVATLAIGGGIYASMQSKKETAPSDTMVSYDHSSNQPKQIVETAYPTANSNDQVNASDNIANTNESVPIEEKPQTMAKEVVETQAANVEPEVINKQTTEAKPEVVVHEPKQIVEKSVAPAESNNGQIDAKQASQHVGERAIVCGQVAQVKEFSKGYYLNLGNSYPHQDATVLVWSSNVDKFDNLTSFEGNPICVDGMINTYKGVPQIEMKSPSQIHN